MSVLSFCITFSWNVPHFKKNPVSYYHKCTGLFISPSGISKIDCATTKIDTAKRSISMDRESLQVFVQPYSCSICAPLHLHNWLSFGKFQDTEHFLIHCERHFSSRLPPSGGTCKYTKSPSTKKNLAKFSIYWYAPFCRVCLGCCAVEFGNPGGTYE